MLKGFCVRSSFPHLEALISRPLLLLLPCRSSYFAHLILLLLSTVAAAAGIVISVVIFSSLPLSLLLVIFLNTPGQKCR